MTSTLPFYLDYIPSDQLNSEYYDLLLHYIASNDDIFNTVINNSTQVVLDKILQIIRDDNIIDKLKALDENLNIKFNSNDKENFDKYTRLFQLCNYISDYNNPTLAKKKKMEEAGYDISDDDMIVNIDSDSYDQEKSVKLRYVDDDISSSDDDEKEEEEDIITLPATIDLIDNDTVINFIMTIFGLKKTDDLLTRILNVILDVDDLDECAKNLHKIVNVTKLRVIPKLLNNKDLISYGLQYNLSENIEDKEIILKELKLKKLFHLIPNSSAKRKLDDNKFDRSNNKKSKRLLSIEKFKLPLDDELLMEKKDIKLPENSYKINKDNYTELHIPPPEKPDSNFTLVSITSLPVWAQVAFPAKETTTLNRIQSEVYPTVFHSDLNILVCAPTGAGKTNIAILSILQMLSKYINENGKIKQNSSFKCVYIAPLRALVQEQVVEFQRRLDPFGVKVVELTGDSDTSKKELRNGHVIVSTPEKWDIISRKFSNGSLIKNVKLMILDEVHLLHEERGPIIEAISIRMMDNKSRIVALSATLPNYQDVADFLKVDPKGLFFFTPDFRPCPLKQEFIAVKGGQNNPVKELININKACYEKVSEHLQQGFQIIVFVHSRKDTVKTAKYILDSFASDTKMKLWLSEQDSSIKNILLQEGDNCENADLSNLIKNGIAIHHAGLSRVDRSQSEDLFADGVIKLLISTKTISWGVNLPAHTVIIKGTDIYSPPLNKWVKLSIQDMLQMLGRAGRPRYDTHGEGIIITNQLGVNHYLALLMDQMNIESRLLDRVIDLANAEIFRGTIKTKGNMISWLKKSYWYIRMMKNRKLYKTESLNVDVFLEMLVDSILDKLYFNNLCNINHSTNNEAIINSTRLGGIASDFYIAHESVCEYYTKLDKEMSNLEIFQLFSKSKEFENMLVRAEEKYEMKIILSRLPLPVRESFEDTGCKPNALIQSYISRLSMDGLSLNADMIFIKQNSMRLFQALLEISKLKKLSKVTKQLIHIVQYVDKRVWLTNTPLRQFDLDRSVIKKIEMSYLDWDVLFNKPEDEDLASLFQSMAPGLENEKSLILPCLSKFPKLKDINISLQPLTKTLYTLTVVFTPSFKWDYKIHKNSISFLIMLEDCNGEEILYENSFRIKSYNIETEVSLQFDIEVQSLSLQPNLFLTLVAESWLHCEYKNPVLIMNELKQVDKLIPPSTEIIDNNIKMIKAEIKKLGVCQFDELFSSENKAFYSEKCNKYHSEVVPLLLGSNENVLFCAAPELGQDLIAKLAVLKSYQLGHARIAYISNYDYKLDEMKKWLDLYYPHDNELIISKLDSSLDNNALFNKSHIILSSFENFEFLSRDWKDYENFQNINLVVFDDLEMISGNNTHISYIYEALITRMVLMETQLEKGLRIVALSNPINNYIEVGEWMGIERSNCFNYSNATFLTEANVDVDFIAYDLLKDNFEYESDQIYDKVFKKIFNSQPVIYVTDRTSAIKTAESLVEKQGGEDTIQKLVGVSEELLSMFTDGEIAKYFVKGISIFYFNMDNDDKMILQKFAKSAKIILSDGSVLFSSELVLIRGTEYEKETSSVLGMTKIEPYKFVNMVASCKLNGKLIILSGNAPYFSKLLKESQFSMESNIPFHFTELLINEINAGIIEKKTDILEWFSYTFFNTRIHNNPSYYGVKNNDSISLSKFVTSLIDQSVEELEDLELIEQKQIINDEGSQDVNLSLSSATFSVSRINLFFEDFAILYVNLKQANNIFQFLELLSCLPSFEHLHINFTGSIQEINKISNNPLLKSYKNKLSPQVFKIFYLLYSFLEEGSAESLPVILQLDLRVIVKNLTPLLFKVLKMYLIKQNFESLSNKRLLLLLNTIKGLSLDIPIFDESLQNQLSLLQIPYITESQIDELMNQKQLEGVEDVIANNLIGFVNEDDDEEVNEFFEKFPVAKITHKLNENLEITLDNYIDNNYNETNSGTYYCIIRLEGEDKILKLLKIGNEGKITVNRDDLPSGTIIIELINDSFITKSQIIKIYN
ncbi:hypothetical protein QEN19_001783 [Hanseniaspora menglaensis]